MSNFTFLMCASGVMVLSGMLIPAHSQNTLPGKSLYVSAGYGKHGSGDLNGIVFGASLAKYHTKRFSLTYNLVGTIHYGKDEYIVNNTTTGERIDASVRYTTAGVQAGVSAGWSIVRTRRFEFLTAIGAFGRFQSASNGSDGYELYLPPRTGQPTILIGYDNSTPQNTFAAGGIFLLQVNYSIGDKVMIGLQPAFQTDTNGDLIPHISFIIGCRS